ncbi:hypothetical protein HMPREF1986_00447 [Oribacterium sp. oral taxon 078 str. F0263]|nr:hypothetical protein HMPREF1986_00447 [Oribacterium sp. oral taxon 078 str. F0263]
MNFQGFEHILREKFKLGITRIEETAQRYKDNNREMMSGRWANG